VYWSGASSSDAGTQAGAGGGASFDPATLFAGGEAGAWYDPSDLSTMFQDTAGATPVTAVGQSVARINDKSGRGNHATQATEASRPILRQDGSGKYYLEFDGSNDRMTTAGAVGLTAPIISAFVGFQNTASGLQGIWSNDRYRQTTFGTNFRFTTIGVLDYSFNSAISVSTNVVMSSVFDAGFDVTFRKNGAAGTFIAGTSDAAGGEAVMEIGARGAANFMSGRIYQLIVRAGAITAGQVQSAESFVGGKTGVFF
jgi:hypothetical protein